MLVQKSFLTFTPRANCFINEFLSALTSQFVRPHSSPLNRATETSHRVEGHGQDKDKRRTRPGHTAQPEEEDKKSPATEDKRRTRPGHSPATEDKRRTRAQSPATEDKRRTRPGHEPSHRGQEEDKAWTRSPATEDKRRTRPGHRAQPQRTRGGQGLDTEPSHRAQPQSSGAQPVSVASSFS